MQLAASMNNKAPVSHASGTTLPGLVLPLNAKNWRTAGHHQESHLARPQPFEAYVVLP